MNQVLTKAKIVPYVQDKTKVYNVLEYLAYGEEEAREWTPRLVIDRDDGEAYCETHQNGMGVTESEWNGKLIAVTLPWGVDPNCVLKSLLDTTSTLHRLAVEALNEPGEDEEGEGSALDSYLADGFESGWQHQYAEDWFADAADGDVTSETTDEEIKVIAKRYEAEAKAEKVVMEDGNIEEYLIRVREEKRDD